MAKVQSLSGGVVLVVSTLLLAVGSSGCGDGSSPGGVEVDPAGPSFAGKGSYPVGVTTLGLSDREVEVFYPADAAAVQGQPTSSYRSFEVLPEAIVAILPPNLNLEVQTDAYRNAPIDPDGPFPVVTFSHGASGFRHAYSAFLTRIASHGMIVVSIDHLEWGLLAQTNLRPPDAVDRTAVDVVLETLSRLDEAGADSASVLYSGVDTSRVATAGHSAGGRAAFGLPDRPEVKAMIGYATGSARGLQTDKPILLLVGAEDGGAARLEEAYEGLSPVKRFVSIDRAGHNSFTDQCAILWGGNNFLEDLVASGFPVPESILSLAIDGCRPENLDPAAFWDTATHFTVAHLRAAFGIEEQPDGLGAGVATRFDGVTLVYLYES